MQGKLKVCEDLLKANEDTDSRWLCMKDGIYEASFDGFDRIIRVDNGAYNWRVFGIRNNGPVQFGSERTLKKAMEEASKSKY